METQINSLTWISAMQHLYSPKIQLKQKILDTVIFDSLEVFRPKEWIYTHASSYIQLKNIRSLTLDDVLRAFIKIQQKTQHKNSKQLNREYLVTCILSETSRVMINTVNLWNIQSNFPQGIQAIQLFDIPTVTFHKLIFIYERNRAEGGDVIYYRSSVGSKMNEGQVYLDTSLYEEINIVIRKDSEAIIDAIEKNSKSQIFTVRLVFKYDVFNI